MTPEDYTLTMPPALLARCEAIPGFMADIELNWLYERARQANNILEIGVYYGRSTTALCLGCPGTVISVDNWMGTDAQWDKTRFMAEDREKRLEVMFQAFRNLAEFRESGKLRLLPMSSKEAWPLIIGQRFYFAFLDGAHDAETVASEIRYAKALTLSGHFDGIIAGHDYNAAHPEVIQAVNEAFPSVQRGPGSIWYVEVK